MKRCLIALALFLSSLAQNFSLAQTTITVGQGVGYDYATIQAAIDAATTGDTIIVYPGIYYENIHFRGFDIIVRSTEPNSSAVVAGTIIDGRTTGSVVTFAGSESSSCVLSGFTVRNGYAWKSGAYFGGGIQGNGTRASILNNIITNNAAAVGGGLDSCEGMIHSNLITSNTASNGAGLSYCNGAIEHNSIVGNHAGTRGGGLLWCHGTIRDNVIADNSTGPRLGRAAGAYGVGMQEASAPQYVDTSSCGGGLVECWGTIEGNMIVGNTTIYYGAGLNGCNGMVRNNVIVGNIARSGGGLYACNGTIQNNTIVNNQAYTGGGVLFSRGIMLNCIVWDNADTAGLPNFDASTTVAYSCIQDWTGGGEGNIADYPWFADDNYYLLPKSPCVDAGNPAPEYNDAYRPPGLGTSRNDMGAYGGPYNCLWPAPAPSARARNWCMYE